MKEIGHVNRILKKNNIEHIFLKGAAHILSNVYENLGERMVGDIDILTKSNKAKKAVKLLDNYSYISQTKNNFLFSFTKHFPRQVNSDKTFAIEIHRFLNKKIDNQSIFKNKISYNNIDVPSISFQLFYNILNYQKNDFGKLHLTYSYRNIYDFYCLQNKSNYSNPYKIDVNNFFIILNELKIPNCNYIDYKNDPITKRRFRLIVSSKMYKLIDYFITFEIRKLNLRFLKIIEIFKNKSYLKFLISKLTTSNFSK